MRRERELLLSLRGSTHDIDPTAVIESAAESILITSDDLAPPGPTILYVNRAFERMTGWTKAEAIGRSPRIMQGPLTDQRIFTAMREKLRSGATWQGQTVNYRKDGSAFWMEWSIVPLRDRNGEIYQYVAIQRDVSGRVEAERQLQESQAARALADRARANLSRYFSPGIVGELAEKDQPLGPVRRQDLAVLFADIVGFTELCELAAPEEVIGLLRQAHGWMGKIIFENKGSIEGYIGDSVLALFGFPAPGIDDASNALACAFELLSGMQRWNRERDREGRAPIGIGIGVTYGPVVLGDVGTEDYVEFTAVGDTVNTASRLQEATRALDCDLVVGGPILDRMKAGSAGSEDVPLIDRLSHYGSLPIRGRSQPVDAWTFRTSSPTGLS